MYHHRTLEEAHELENLYKRSKNDYAPQGCTLKALAKLPPKGMMLTRKTTRMGYDALDALSYDDARRLEVYTSGCDLVFRLDYGNKGFILYMSRMPSICSFVFDMA